MFEILQKTELYWVAALGIIGFITRNIIKLILDRNLEKQKISLQKKAMEHQIVFSKLYTDQGDVLKRIYSKIAIMERSMQDLVGYTTKEKGDKAIEDVLSLKYYFEENKIFFNEDLANQIDELISTAHNAYFEASWNSEHRIAEITMEDIKKETLENRLKGLKKVRHTLPPLKRKIESEFREILGVRVNKNVN